MRRIGFEADVSDTAMRALVNDVAVPRLDGTPFTVAPPLARARVAIVTTAALRQRTDDRFAAGDESFRVLPDAARDLALDHLSPNWDRSGLAADLNVAYPIDRLQELADNGVIGAVAPRHLSFHGVIDGTLTTILLDTGPAAGRLLRHDGVDVALLVPV